jgi:hypothetical protein
MTEKRCPYIPLAAAAAILIFTPVPAEAGDGLVALQTADPSCPDSSGNIYVNCGNGTVTDNRTGLVWLANADCLSVLSWQEATETVSGLADLPEDVCGTSTPETDDECDCGLSDNSSPGEWRLPSIVEWKEMMADAGGALNCDPRITDDQGNGCWSESCYDGLNCSFRNVVGFFYYSSSTRMGSPTNARGVNLGSGTITSIGKTGAARVWPVRGGQ